MYQLLWYNIPRSSGCRRAIVRTEVEKIEKKKPPTLRWALFDL